MKKCYNVPSQDYYDKQLRDYIKTFWFIKLYKLLLTQKQLLIQIWYLNLHTSKYTLRGKDKLKLTYYLLIALEKKLN